VPTAIETFRCRHRRSGRRAARGGGEKERRGKDLPLLFSNNSLLVLKVGSRERKGGRKGEAVFEPLILLSLHAPWSRREGGRERGIVATAFSDPPVGVTKGREGGEKMRKLYVVPSYY